MGRGVVAGRMVGTATQGCLGHAPGPNRIGVTCCTIESVHGRELTVVGLDAVSGKPVIDVKSTMVEFRAENIKQPEWVSDLMSEYFQP
ncbi:TrmO family methyltransferase [Streptomyces sp. NPDC050422]|uniref:TrmO family methyltransferase domain-containing protein n=1 Tax=Streptomyces sp. NPDC050422 TaxID=3365614 RepID=UPI0037A6147E